MGNEGYDHNSFVLYKDSRIFINRLDIRQRGILMTAIFDYVCDETVFDFKGDEMLQMCFEIIKSYLDRDEKKYRERCEKNRENIEKRWGKKRNQSNTNVCKRNQSNTNYTDNDTDKDTDTDSDNDTVSDTDTETDTQNEDVDCVSVDRQSASAAAESAEPPSGDLFSVKQLIATAKKNKINITTDGIEVFYEEMHENDWVLYDKPIKKRGIVKALRGWAKYHPEYSPENIIQEAQEIHNKENPEITPEPEFDPTNIEMIQDFLKEMYGENIIEEKGFSNEELLDIGKEIKEMGY